MNNEESMEGKILGHYELQHLLGTGGAATVFLAKDIHLQREVAVKIYRPKGVKAGEFLLRFEREARVLAKLDHPHILTVYDYGEDADLAYLVMPHMSGGSLRDRLQITPRLPEETAIPLIAQILDALQYAHEQGLIHRDIKPGNMLLKKDDMLVLSDFGLVKLLPVEGGVAALEKTSTLTEDEILGTPDYIPPEQIDGKVEPASDIYAIGAVLYEMLTGHKVFQAENALLLLMKHIHEDPLPPGTYNSALSPTVESIIMRTLQKDPQQRYQSPAELRQALLAALEQKSQQQKSSQENAATPIINLSHSPTADELSYDTQAMQPHMPRFDQHATQPCLQEPDQPESIDKATTVPTIIESTISDDQETPLVTNEQSDDLTQDKSEYAENNQKTQREEQSSHSETTENKAGDKQLENTLNLSPNETKEESRTLDSINNNQYKEEIQKKQTHPLPDQHLDIIANEPTQSEKTPVIDTEEHKPTQPIVRNTLTSQQTELQQKKKKERHNPESKRNSRQTKKLAEKAAEKKSAIALYNTTPLYMPPDPKHNGTGIQTQKSRHKRSSIPVLVTLIVIILASITGLGGAVYAFQEEIPFIAHTKTTPTATIAPTSTPTLTVPTPTVQATKKATATPIVTATVPATPKPTSTTVVQTTPTTACPTASQARSLILSTWEAGNSNSAIYAVNQIDATDGIIGTLKSTTINPGTTNNTTGTTIVALSGDPITGAEISRDGEWILFTTTVGQHDELRTIRVDGQDQQTLYCTNNGQKLSGPQWSFKQRYIAFTVTQTGKLPIVYLLDVTTGHLVQDLIAQSGMIYTAQTWIGDRFIYLLAGNTNQTTSQGLYLLDINKGPNQSEASLTQILTGNTACQSFDTSYDLSKLYISTCQNNSSASATPDSNIQSEPIQGGQSNTIYITTQQAITSIRTLDNSTLYAIVENQTGDTSQNGLWQIQNGAEKSIAPVNAGDLSFTPYSQYIWSNFSVDQSMVTLKAENTTTNTQKLLAITTASGTIDNFASTTDGSNLQFVGWTKL